jgi:cytochrome c-type biogenesis protein CcmH
VTRVAGAILMVALAVIGGPAAAITPQRFEDPAQQRQYEALLPELRCLVCQNETLADSEAPLAEDLRREVAEMVRAGHDSAAIKDFLVARYGDFVLYRPSVKPLTYALWFGPFALLLLGSGVWLALTRRERRAGVESPRLSEAEHQRARALLDGKQGPDAS